MCVFLRLAGKENSMSTVRLAPALRRSALLALLLIVTAASATLVLRRALACPIEIPPQPLRTLYKLSERVVVARVGASELVQNEENTALMKTALHVTDTLKGDAAQVVPLYHRVFTGADAGDAGIEILTFNGRIVPQIKQGERMLFFLERREEGDGYEVDDYGYGVKKLSDDDLKVYIKRIEELAAITKQEPLDKKALVEWLVRCAEERATRWEGAYELKLSAEAAEIEKEKKSKAKDEGAEASEAAVEDESGDGTSDASVEVAGAQAQPEAEPAAMPPDETPLAEGDAPEVIKLGPVRPLFPRYTERDPSLVALLGEEQKRRLADAFFGAEQIEEGEDALLPVVKEFNDSRLTGFLLAQLHRVEAEPPFEAEGWLSVLADALKNENISKLVADYSEKVSYYEAEETADESADSAGDESAESVEDESAESAEDESAAADPDPQAEAAAYSAGVERAARKRGARLKDLLSQIDRFINSGELASN
jgi:hypothetical protein